MIRHNRKEWYYVSKSIAIKWWWWGGINVNPQTPSELNNTFTRKGINVVIEGAFSVSTYRNSTIFLTGLPKPKAEISNGGNMSTTNGSASSSITITTNGEAKINDYNGFSAGYTWNYSIIYPIE